MTNRHAEPVMKETANVLGERIEQLRQLFPEAFSEGQIDFENLRSALGDSVNGQPERYSFTWAGKRDAIRLLQTPSRATLVPVEGESVNFDTTEHLFIEGDNLEVLKLLYKPYFGRVKMIYIDPPYNTGNDFVYPDNYADPLDTYLQLTGQKDAQGNLLTSNPETSGRYHSAWLSMMYPRLFLARQLLHEDGVIFVNIDDHEVHNLRLVMNEVFGEENFLGTIVRATGTTTGQDSRGLGSSFDYLLAYSKSGGYEIGGLPLSQEDTARFTEEDEKGRYSSLQLRKTGSADRRADRPFMYYAVEAPDGTQVFPIGPGGYESRWRCGPATYKELVKDGLVTWKKVKKEGSEQWTPYVKYYLEGREKRPSPLWTDLDGNKKATIEVKELLGDKAFDNPKPTALILRLLQISTEHDTNDLILDFFAGSCTTAQALLELNREDGGNRHFIMVQLPEPTGNKDYPTIAEIGKERIRRVIARMKKEREGQLALDTRESPEDLGFKVFKLTPSNYRPWPTMAQPGSPETYAAQMDMFADPLVSGWTPENVIYEVAIKEGYGLNCRITRVDEVRSNVVYRVTDADKEQTFLICLDDRIELAALKPLNLMADDLFICRDRALDDETAANLALQCRLKTI